MVVTDPIADFLIRIKNAYLARRGEVRMPHSKLKEESIDITKQEFDFLKQVNGNKLHKIRHNFMYNGRLCEFDVFQGALKGLVVVEFEFDNEEEKKNFHKSIFVGMK